jgi:hypothetical protein
MNACRIVSLLLSSSLIASVSAATAEEQTLLSGIAFGKNAERWEVRAGAAVYDFGPFSPQSFSGAVINGEVLAPSPGFLGFIGSPRPYLGADIAVSDHPIHVVYAGLNWEAYLSRRLYLGFSAGGSLNNRRSQTNEHGEVKDLGSSVLFHLQASAGYDFTENMTAQVYINHFSNAQLGSSNDGLESMGARLGFRF